MNDKFESGGRDTADRSRRAFLEQAGHFAAYTPPVLLGLLIPGKHAIASGFQLDREAERELKQEIKLQQNEDKQEQKQDLRDK
jgi:hypothetical protein